MQFRIEIVVISKNQKIRRKSELQSGQLCRAVVSEIERYE